MAENKKTTKPAKATENATEENILDVIKTGNKMTESVLKEAEAEIEKEKDDKKKATLKRCILKADYTNKRELLELRKRRAEEKATKEMLATSKTLLDDLKGGKITPNEYEEGLNKASADKKKAFDNVEEEHSKNCQELRDGFSGYYAWDWEWEHRCRRY